jgi:catechol 2,3-dioxygenase-like lactoylglutathione lyase family enzyme
MELGGLHHMTAVTTDAAENVAFYTEVLGLRLVKKTVNQDDVSAYHLFYGDEVGNPGTEVTFFDCPQPSRRRRGLDYRVARPRPRRARVVDQPLPGPRRGWRRRRRR